MTPEVLELKHEVARLSDSLQAVWHLAQNLWRQSGYSLCVSAALALVLSLLPRMIGEWSAHYPQDGCEPATLYSRKPAQGLLIRELGLALSLKQPEYPGLCDEAIASGVLVAPVLCEHWSEAERRQPLSPIGLVGEALIEPSAADPPLAHPEDYLSAVEPLPQVEIVAQIYTLARALVGTEAGLALVDPFIALGADPHNTAIRSLSLAFLVALYAITHAGEIPPRTLAPLLRMLVRRVEERSRAVQMQHLLLGLPLETLDAVLAHTSRTYRSGFQSGQSVSQPRVG